MFRFDTNVQDLLSPYPRERDTLPVHVSAGIRPTESVDHTHRVPASNEQASIYLLILHSEQPLLLLILAALWIPGCCKTITIPLARGDRDTSVPIILFCTPGYYTLDCQANAK